MWCLLFLWKSHNWVEWMNACFFTQERLHKKRKATYWNMELIFFGFRIIKYIFFACRPRNQRSDDCDQKVGFWAVKQGFFDKQFSKLVWQVFLTPLTTSISKVQKWPQNFPVFSQSGPQNALLHVFLQLFPAGTYAVISWYTHEKNSAKIGLTNKKVVTLQV